MESDRNERRNERVKNHIAFLLLGVIASLLLLAAANCPACAETTASPKEAALPGLKGDLELSDQPVDIRAALCLRVNLPRIGRDGAWVYLTFPKAVSGIQAVLLFDGWHLLHGEWEQINETTLRLHFLRGDLLRMDGTVGLYLLILTE